MNRFVWLLTLVAAPVGAAELIITSDSNMYLGNDRKYSLSIETAPGEVFRGLDARFDGPMTQAAAPRVFDRVQIDFGIPHREVDSYFDFRETEVLVLAATESATSLVAAFTEVPTSLPTPKRFAQIVTSEPWNVSYALAFDLGGPEAVIFRGTLVPEPSAIGVLLAAAAAAWSLARRVPTT